MVAGDGWMPDMILGIARGGLLVAGALGYALGIKNTFTMNVEFYTGIDERLEMPMILPPVPDLLDFADFTVLIADDVADTGATLQLVKEFCAGKVAEVLGAVLLVVAAVAAVLALGTSPGAAKSNDTFQAAWIYVGPHNDGGWSQAHDVGRLYVQKTLGSKVQTTYKELVPEGPQTCQVI